MFTKRKRQSRPETSRRMGRNGIPIVEKGENLATLFQSLGDGRDDTDDQSSGIGPGEPVSCSWSGEVPRNKHGLPVLDSQGNLKLLLEQSGTGTDDDIPFGELVDSSLQGKDMDALLREKREREIPGPVPLKKRLRRYPGPEVQLDLHGLTASQAETRIDSFVRTAWRKGTFTMRIIVGRGLHSEFGAVLPDVAQEVLDRLKQQRIVLWFEWDRKKKSISGAVVVYLNQFKD